MRSNTLGRVLVAAALSLGACGGDGDGDAGASTPRGPMEVDQAVVVETRPALQETLSVTGAYSGEVRADRVAVVSADVSGRILEVPVRMGDRIEADGLLARLDAVPYEQRIRELEAAAQTARAQVREATTAIRRATRELERKEPLLANKLVTELEVDQLRSDVAVGKQQIALARARVSEAEAQLETAREDLRRTVVRAPFAGRIAERNVEVGTHVAPAERLFRIVSDCDLYVRIAVPEMEATRIRRGEEAELRLDAVDDRTLAGRVLRTAPNLDPETRTLRVDVVLDAVACDEASAGVEGEVAEADAAPQALEGDAEPPPIRPGMYARASISLGRVEGATTVPNQALSEDRGGAAYVWVVAEDLAERRSVRRGLRGERRTQILEGVAPDEEVVIRGQDKLEPGSEIRRMSLRARRIDEGAR